MLSQDQLNEEEEQLRTAVSNLPDTDRRKYFHLAEKKLKDPDTYAVLNWFFIAGLHHFYLGRWSRGIINISVFTIGVILLFTSLIAVGLALIISITVIELYALFYSQRIVQHFNNEAGNAILDQLNKK